VALSPGVGAYAGVAEVWAADAALAYGPLARHLVDRVPGPLHGTLGLDVGAGSGVAGRALRDRGVRVLSADREVDMASYVARSGPAVAADVTRLPFRTGTFDVVVAAFVVNHLPDPVGGLRELRRVTGHGGAVLVSTFATDRARAKAAVDEVAAAHGFVRPDWYDDLQSCAQTVGGTAAMRDALLAAGFSQARVTEEPVDVGLSDPADVVRYRLGLPHLHAFVTTLSPGEREVFVTEAEHAVARTGGPFVPRVVEAFATR
jgi:SAM-dependent methyltransferase